MHIIKNLDRSNSSISSPTNVNQYQNFYNKNREQRQNIIIPELEKYESNKNDTFKTLQNSPIFSKIRVL